MPHRLGIDIGKTFTDLLLRGGSGARTNGDHFDGHTVSA